LTTPRNPEETAAASIEQAELFTLTTLEQIKVLADPLRVRILECFCKRRRTTKQVAELLGEKPTRLYHHVEALERVGLIRLTETRPVRGTVEKYFISVAKAYRADSSLFRGETAPEDQETFTRMVTTVMDNTAEDLRRLVGTGCDLGSGEEAILSYNEFRASEKRILEVRDKLMALLQELRDEETPDAGPDVRRYRLTLAYFPLDLSERADSTKSETDV
jgi:DNA-binding transcriptional ArsR family regulator